ncbi:hypothetical protein LTR53_005415 [Teratosphaeriaceae sp. CCFEE 6253]|nr:hypothetical protein LTR53_005415 [Teratosphaeriaceae sp. CCFEE 6253]
MPDIMPLQERDANTPTLTKGAIAKKRSRKAPDDEKPQDPPQPKKQRKNNATPPSAEDISDIHLDGEADEATPIFDTCDDVRRKLRQALSNTTQADLARRLDALLPTSSVSSRQIAPFMKFKGPQAGAHSPVFYAAYVYFEKRRLAEKKKKSAKREKTEQIWSGRRDEEPLHWNSKGSPLGGFPREGAHNARLTCHVSERWRQDQYGEVHITS